MPQPVPFVFVSATSHDLRSYRHAARDQLLVGGAYPVVQEYFEPDYRALRDFLRDKLARCDAVICLVGFVYGAEPPTDPSDPSATRRSYTQIEYDVARELGKPIYVFLAQDDCEFDRAPEQDDAERELQQAHRAALESNGAKWTPFRSHEQLKTRIAELIPALPRAAGRLAPRLEHPPTVPAYFAGRALELRQLDRALRERVPAVVVVLGIGGQENDLGPPLASRARSPRVRRLVLVHGVPRRILVRQFPRPDPRVPRWQRVR